MTSYVWFVRGERHANLCRTSIESVRRADPTARCFVMTDDVQDKHWELDAATYFIRPGQPIMLANLDAQVAAMFVTHPDEPVVFLDTDILLLKPLPCLGDLTITWRDHVGMVDDEKVEGVAAQMPFNYGVMVAQHSSAAVEAFIFMRERIRRMHSRYQNWYGNQLALAELSGNKPELEHEVVDRAIPWTLTSQGNKVRIAKIPAQQYNFTPQRIGEDISEKYVLHFKGGARALMESYASRLGIGWYDQKAAA
jgi:hypothetical protein